MVNHTLAKVPSGARTVAVAHAFIAGSLESESERPLSVGGSGMVSANIFAPFNYTALGHLHNSQQAGGPNIRYSGSLLKYSFAEANQKKGINLVEIDQAGNAIVEAVSLTPRRNVRCLDGFFKDILDASGTAGSKDDYVMVTLRDTAPILDARGQLQAVYPNILHIEYPRLSTAGSLRGPEADHRRLTEKELFGSFFTQMTDEQLTDEQTAEFAAVVDELYRQIREVKA